MELLGVALLVVSAAGFAVRGGAVLGVGLLLPWLGRTGAERWAVHGDFRPAARCAVWWLCLLAVPAAGLRGLPSDLPDAALLCGVAVLALLVIGEAAVGAVDRPRWRTRRSVVWSYCGGSWLVTLGGAWAFGGVLLGGGDRDGLVVLLPLSALALTAVVAGHGLACAARRLTGRPLERARRLAGPRGDGLLSLTTLALALLPVVVVVRLPVSEYTVRPVLTGVLAGVLLGTAAVARWAGRPRARR